jgi:hypothetical protein
MTEKTKLVALMGGGDWADASVDHLVIPESMNLDEQKQAWRKWYDEEYCPALHRNEKPTYLGLSEWLVKNGARKATETDVVEFWDL